MKKYQSKSIKTVFNAHLNEIYAYLNFKEEFSALKEKVNNLLDDEELKNNESVQEAKQIFKQCSNNYNRYVSTLLTYITGIKVS